MGKSNSSSTSSGMGCCSFFCVLLGVLFVGLKLTGYISWSWVWVTLPIWGYALFVALAVVLVVVAWAIGEINKKRKMEELIKRIVRREE